MMAMGLFHFSLKRNWSRLSYNYILSLAMKKQAVSGSPHFTLPKLSGRLFLRVVAGLWGPSFDGFLFDAAPWVCSVTLSCFLGPTSHKVKWKVQKAGVHHCAMDKSQFCSQAIQHNPILQTKVVATWSQLCKSIGSFSVRMEEGGFILDSSELGLVGSL